MNAHMSRLMDKEVSRSEFLGVLGLTAASIFGLGTLVKLLTGKSLANHHVTSGYGSSSYGGSTEGH